MTSEERHEVRYQRRKAKRLQKLADRQEAVGDLSTALSYAALYEAGRDACKGVRWKTSTINFELRLFSRTAAARRKLVQNKWKSHNSCTFHLVERGHKRKIDAPHINDRQVHKATCRKVLRPLYYPHMIYDNGASIEGKGFSFTMDRTEYFLKWWYERYGTEGVVVTVDFKGYFPNAPHDAIESIHEKYILCPDLRYLSGYLLNAFGPVGMALGVETSQTEAGILPNAIDHTIKDQHQVECSERYMDDTLFIVHTDEEADALIDVVSSKCKEMGLKLNHSKTHKNKLSGWFKFCQWRYHLTDSGKVIKKPARTSITTMQRKLKAWARKISAKEMTRADAQEAYGCWRAYMLQGNSHNILRKMDRRFKKLLGCEPIVTQAKKRRKKKRKFK